MANTTPLVILNSENPNGVLELADGTSTQIGSSLWQGWLGRNSSFRFQNGLAKEDSFTARKHMRKSGEFWYAYRKVDNKLRSAYVGKSESLTVERMLEAAAKLYQSPQTKAKSQAITELVVDETLPVETAQLYSRIIELERQRDELLAKCSAAEKLVKQLQSLFASDTKSITKNMV